MTERMRGEERRAQILALAATEFAKHGLHGASVETIARAAGITQAYVFRMFGTKKALFLELVRDSFERFTEGMSKAGVDKTGVDALAEMGQQYYELLADRTNLLLQLQGFAACADTEVRDMVREQFAAMWSVVAETSGADPVTVKSFLAYGMLLNASAALDLSQVDEMWARGIGTHINAGLFGHITSETNR